MATNDDCVVINSSSDEEDLTAGCGGCEDPILISSGDEEDLAAGCGGCDDPIVISSDEDSNLQATAVISPFCTRMIEMIDLSEEDTELPSAESLIRQTPTTPDAMEIDDESKFVTRETPLCIERMEQVNVEETRTEELRKKRPLKVKQERNMQRQHIKRPLKFSQMKPFKPNISSTANLKLEKPVTMPLSREEMLRLFPPTRHQVSLPADSADAVRGFNDYTMDYIQSISDISLEECVSRFISPRSAPPTDLVVQLMKRLTDSKDLCVSSTVYILLRHCLVLLMPLPSQHEVQECLRHIMDTELHPGASLCMSLLISIIEQLQRCQLGKPIFRPATRWKSQLCGWLMLCATRNLGMAIQTHSCLPVVTQLQQLVTHYCFDSQDESVNDNLAETWVDIYKATPNERWRSIIQNMGDHCMRALFLDKLLTVRFQRTHDQLSEQDRISWSAQSPSVSKTVFLHFHREPHSNVSEYLMLIGYLLQSCIMSHLSANYQLSINTMNTQRFKEECQKLRDTLKLREGGSTMLDLAVELADVFIYVE